MFLFHLKLQQFSDCDNQWLKSTWPEQWNALRTPCRG
jgi:hypothetical protein